MQSSGRHVSSTQDISQHPECRKRNKHNERSERCVCSKAYKRYKSYKNCKSYKNYESYKNHKNHKNHKSHKRHKRPRRCRRLWNWEDQRARAVGVKHRFVRTWGVCLPLGSVGRRSTLVVPRWRRRTAEVR